MLFNNKVSAIKTWNINELKITVAELIGRKDIIMIDFFGRVAGHNQSEYLSAMEEIIRLKYKVLILNLENLSEIPVEMGNFIVDLCKTEDEVKPWTIAIGRNQHPIPLNLLDLIGDKFNYADSLEAAIIFAKQYLAH